MGDDMAKKNWKDSTVFIGDNLKIMQEMNSGHIDLIYCDPPFNSNHNYAAPAGSEAAGAGFKDTWTLSDIDEMWYGYLADKHPALFSLVQATGEVGGDSMKSYLIYMAVRILEMKRLLKPTGSIYLHCDPTAGHYLKLAMDAIFGRENFRNELVWYYKNASRGKKQFAKSHDVILWYSVDGKGIFNRNDILVPYESGMTEWRYKKAGKQPPAGKTPDDVIIMPSLNTMDKERVGYPTQKPRKLLERIIKASSNKGDIVFDPFCGCATTCIAAHDLGRKWVGIDISPKAGELVKLRMEKQFGLLFDGEVMDNPPKRSPDDRTEDELYRRQAG